MKRASLGGWLFGFIARRQRAAASPCRATVSLLSRGWNVAARLEDQEIILHVPSIRSYGSCEILPLLTFDIVQERPPGLDFPSFAHPHIHLIQTRPHDGPIFRVHKPPPGRMPPLLGTLEVADHRTRTRSTPRSTVPQDLDSDSVPPENEPGHEDQATNTSSHHRRNQRPSDTESTSILSSHPVSAFYSPNANCRGP